MVIGLLVVGDKVNSGLNSEVITGLRSGNLFDHARCESFWASAVNKISNEIIVYDLTYILRVIKNV